MSLKTDGEAPGLVRFYLACDMPACRTRAVFDLVIATAPPPIDEDLFGHLMHSTEQAAEYIGEQGWQFVQTFGYWCPNCSTPREERRPAPSGTARRQSPPRRQRRDPKRP